ncbi:MAG: rRNA maturation RNase YbeY [Patescibacteria group bacterium]|nr:rRNA maturation RNase YbeY [Patescibacteria group bacterium]
MNKVVVVSDLRFRKLGLHLKATIQKSLKVLNKNNLAFDVYLIKDVEMKRLNLRFRGKNKITSVLSFVASPKFPQPDLRPPLRYIGEIYLAPDYIEKQKQNIELLAIHGLLHLLGYTHRKKNDKLKMEHKELEIISKLKNF